MTFTGTTPGKRTDPKSLLSTLWIVVMINMLAADILSLYIPGSLDELTKTAGNTPIAQLMLGGAIMMELAIAVGITAVPAIVGPYITGPSDPSHIINALIATVMYVLVGWRLFKLSQK